LKASRHAHLFPFLVLAILILLAAALRLWKLDALPPGLFGDEAINGVDERFVLNGSGLPIYFAANNGREPLFLYLQMLSVALLGATPLALRAVSAFSGILTVPAIYFCARTMFRPSDGSRLPEDAVDWKGTWAALLAAAGAAVSYWAVSLSRLGLRAVLLPLVSAVAIAFFWRAWQGGRRRDYIWAGFWLGVAPYTYTSGRLLLLVPIAFVLLQTIMFLSGRGRRTPQSTWRAAWRPRLIGLAILAGVLIVVLVPLALAALQDPAILAGRVGQVSILGGAPSSALARLIQNLVAVARNFYDRGDINLRQNLPGRPANDLLLAILFTSGFLTALWRIRRPENQMILIWLAVMLVPTVLSTGAPHSLRAAGALAPLCLLYGLGGSTVLELASRLRLKRYLAPALLGVVLLVSSALTARDYFGRWAVLPKLGAAFNLEQQLAASTATGILGDSSNGTPVLISYRLYSHPQMTFALGLPTQVPLPDWASTLAARREIRYVLNEHFDRAEPMYLVWREGGQLMEAAVDPLGPTDATALATAVQTGGPGDVIRARSSQPDWPELRSGVLPDQVRLRPRHIDVPLDVTFADGIRLIGYNIEPDWVPGDAEPAELRLSLFWELGQQKERGVIAPEAFVHLANAAGVWQTSNGAFTNYLMPWLKKSHVIEDIRLVPVPPDMPKGKALFQVGLYVLSSFDGLGARDRIDIIDRAGKRVADRVDLGTVFVGQVPSQADRSGLRAIDARFGPSIRLEGWNVAPDGSSSNALKVDLDWQAVGRSPSDYTAFVHLIDASGKILAQHDESPGGQENPTSHWVPGETIRSTFVLQVPPGIDLKDLRLRTGLYEPLAGKQVPLQLEGGSPTGVESHGTYLVLPAVN
jgi:hypothetical protein